MVLDTIRLGLHVLAATVWVGGQIVLVGLVPTLRAIDAEAPRAAARRFNLIAWPAYVLLLFTGIWNVLELPEIPRPAFEIKFSLFLLSGIGAYLHTRAQGRTAQLAVGGALSSLGAVGALFLGAGFRFLV